MLGTAVSSVPAAEPEATKKPGFAIQFDPNSPSPAVWLAYLLARLNYVMKHESEYPRSGSGTIVATFPEEVEGRTSAARIYRELGSDGKSKRDSYWDDLARVSAAGFMKEYVWTYFRKPSWNESEAPKKLAKFTSWKKTALAGHKPVTYGAIGHN